MFIRVQRLVIALFLIAVLSAASTACWAEFSDITILPLVGDPDDAVYCQAALQAISQSQHTIDILLSSVSTVDNPILPALAEAAGRGVVVRAVLDASDWAPDITTKNLPTLAYFLDNGIQARFDDPAVTLHAKLMIVDREITLLGSSNWNHYALTEHRQADVLIQATSIASFYGEYFEALWSGSLADVELSLALPDGFGSASAVLPLADIPESASYARVLIELLRRAERSIHVSMYRISLYTGYTDSLANDIVTALIDAAHRGLEVKVLLDDCSFYAESAEANLMSAIFLHQRGVEVRLDEPNQTTHSKLVIIDGHTVLLGSTNWNYYSLEMNCETDMVFVDLAAVASAYGAWFQMLWAAGQPLAL